VFFSCDFLMHAQLGLWVKIIAFISSYLTPFLPSLCSLFSCHYFSASLSLSFSFGKYHSNAFIIIVGIKLCTLWSDAMRPFDVYCHLWVAEINYILYEHTILYKRLQCFPQGLCPLCVQTNILACFKLAFICNFGH
jgi:hypothetical protein